VSGRQSRFEGSDRQGRGRLMRAAGQGPVAVADVAAAAGWPTQPVRAVAAADSLVADGLLVLADGSYRLP
jgi:A/G-specific adenine glycosylase